MTDTQLEPALLDVRRAFRLLHNYQRAVLDAANYIGKQLDLNYGGGYPKFSQAPPRAGHGRLDCWAWDWLNMMMYEFHFTRKLSSGDVLRLSIILISDTGFFCSTQESSEETDVRTFLPPEKSQTVIGILMSAKEWDAGFMDNRSQMKAFIAHNGELPPEYADKGIFGTCHPFSRIVSEESTNQFVNDIVAEASRHNIPLSRHKCA